MSYEYFIEISSFLEISLVEVVHLNFACIVQQSLSIREK